VLDVYDSQLGMLRIGPFNYEPMRGIDLWLSQPDEFILQHLSTTPEVEPPHFVMQVRATLKFIQDNQFPGELLFYL
jgi:protein N-terminal asparagine amidohydrolase